MSSGASVFSVPQRKIDAGTVWHYWDGHDWWRGDPNDVTRAMTISRIGASVALAAFAPNHLHSDIGTRAEISPEFASSLVSWLESISEVPHVSSRARRW